MFQVEAVGFRIAQAELCLLFRHREARISSFSMVEGKNQSCQGRNFSLLLADRSCSERNSIIMKISIAGLQVGKGLSKDEKAQKLALQHWLEAVSLTDHAALLCISSCY